MTHLRLLPAALVLFAAPSLAHAWDPFIVENPTVAEGNRLVRDQNYQGALERYDRAAGELPSEPGVALDRGIALLGMGDHDRAREALLRATEPPASDDLRADAYYNLGLSFYRQGDEVAASGDHEQSQRLFREAIDAYSRSLRARPGDRDTAWNLELALRRLREEEQAQQEQEQQEQEEQEGEEGDNDDQGNQDQDQSEPDQGSEGGDNQTPDPEGQDQRQDDQEEQEQDQQQGNEEESQQNQEGDDQSQQAPHEGGDDPRQDQQQRDQGQAGGEGDPSQARPDQEEVPHEGNDRGTENIPEHVARVLDQLGDQEETLERARARLRGQREQRQPVRDW